MVWWEGGEGWRWDKIIIIKRVRVNLSQKHKNVVGRM